MTTLAFLDQVLASAAKPEDIDDFVSAWHASTTDKRPLHSFLGLTEEEYHNWVLAPDTLQHIIEIQRLTRAARIELTHAVAKADGRIN